MDTKLVTLWPSQASDLQLMELIEQVSMCWHVDLIDTIFDWAGTELIKGIPLSVQIANRTCLLGLWLIRENSQLR